MTPAARYQAAIEVLDEIRAGMVAEQALTRWARQSRFAGSRDRAAVRDHVYDVIRRKRSCAALGGGDTGRALILGHLKEQGLPHESVFAGDGYGPAPLSQDERGAGRTPTEEEALDLPDWLAKAFARDLGDQAVAVAKSLRHRAPVFLRVNLAKTNRDAAISALEADNIATVADPLSPTALRVEEGARRVANSTAFQTGLVELQDVASQAVSDMVPLPPKGRVLDYCAGGGGKSLALAARASGIRFDAHDVDPRRMKDLPARAKRAGCKIRTVEQPSGRYDLVMCDVPCSGSGAWRRSPEGKWALTRDRLNQLCDTQAQILDTCANLVAPNGRLAYLTCSVLAAENEDQISSFLTRHRDWRRENAHQFLPIDGGDGFFFSVLVRK